MARIIRHRENPATFDTVCSMALHEEDEMVAQTQSPFAKPSLPNVLVATTPSTNQSNTIGTSGIDPCQNFRRGNFTYGNRHKFNADGSLSGYKARLVANGRSQRQGINCDETFSPVVKPATIHTVLSLAVSRDWPIHQLDVKNAFLHGHLSKIVYMHQPHGSFTTYYCFASHRSASSMFLSQSKFVEEIPERAHMHNCNSCQTPIDTESKLGSDGDPVSDPTLFAVLLVLFSILPLRAQTYLMLFSSAEAEYQGVANVVAETAWIRNLLLELPTPLITATLVYYDNVSAVYMSANPVQHQRTKHIEIDIHFVYDFVASGQVRVLHVPSKFQYAYIFTKGLPTALFHEFCSSLNVQSPPAHTKREY
ncbi:ribonuclease H-like domain-containing protein [Tanacetum coccineum]